MTHRLGRFHVNARIWLVPLLFLFSCWVDECRAGERSEQPPNMVFILVDDLGWADLPCYGNRFNETPNIDRLASEGLRFTNFYAAAPVCSPTRASILSGQYQARFGLTAHIPGHWRPFARLAEPPTALAMPLEIRTLAEALRDQGYSTAHFGKWHLGGRGFTPEDQGFDEAIVISGHTVPGRRQIPPARRPKRLTDYLADKAIDFMQRHRDQPFFIHLCHYAVHIPLQTTNALESKYGAKTRVEGYPCNPTYAGLLEELDQSVGRICQALQDLQLADRTLVVFTSDNGGLVRRFDGRGDIVTTNAPLRDEKGSLYEGGIRVPLIVRWPGRVPPNSTCDEAAISIDFYPTLLAAAGGKPRPGQILDGVNLMPLWRNPATRLPPRALYWHYPHYHHSRPAGAVRFGPWKLIEFFDTGRAELYNLADDLSESNDLADKEQQQANKLRGMLADWRHRVCAQMPQANPAYRKDRAGEWWSRRLIAPAGKRRQPR